MTMTATASVDPATNPNPKHDRGTHTATVSEYTLSRQVYFVAALLAISLAMTAGLLLWSAKRLDTVAVSESNHLAATAVNIAVNHLSNVVADYTLWDDAYQALVPGLDREWAESNLSGDLNDTFGITQALIVDEANRVIYQVRDGEIAAEGVPRAIDGDIRGGVEQLLASARRSVMADFTPATAVLAIGGVTHLATASVIRPHGDELAAAVSLTPETVTVAIFMRPIDQAFLDAMASDYNLANLRYVTGDPVDLPYRIDLVAPDGTSFGALAWDIELPSSSLLTLVVPTIIAVVACIGLLGWYFLAGIRRGQHALWLSMRKAQAADKAKTEFLANMSHELRTPLNAVIGFAEIMKIEAFGSLGNDKYREYCANIEDSGHHLLDIIDDILDLSKIEAGKFDLDEEPVDLAALSDGVLRIIEPRAREGGVELKNNIDRALPSLLADKRAVKQVLLNLLSNAVKFSPTGASVTLEARIGNDGDLWISVSDTGIGIPRAQLTAIMEPFNQVGSAMTRSQSGTGLGLPLAASLTQLHGGRISLQSEEGQGTTASISLPARRLLAA